MVVDRLVMVVVAVVAEEDGKTIRRSSRADTVGAVVVVDFEEVGVSVAEGVVVAEVPLLRSSGTTVEVRLHRSSGTMVPPSAAFVVVSPTTSFHECCYWMRQLAHRRRCLSWV